MAKLVKIVAGRAYEVEDTNEIIPAANLVPFGSTQQFPGDTEFYFDVKKRPFFVNLDLTSIKKCARDYMGKMDVPFGELIKTEEVIIQKTSIFGRKSYRGFTRMGVQLYVENKPSFPKQE